MEHDDDLGPDIYAKGYDTGYRQGQKDLWRKLYDILATLFPDPCAGATSPSEQKGMTPTCRCESPAEEPPGAVVAPVRGTPHV